MTSMRDMLEYYNNLDVIPFLEAIEKTRRFWIDQAEIDMFDCISLPGLAERYLMKTREPHSYFMLPQKTPKIDNSHLFWKYEGSYYWWSGHHLPALS